MHLSALLKGKALDVYSRLPTDDSMDYEKLKTALLKRFELTEEGFRKRFKAARPEKGETFVQYFRRSRNYLERWFELGSVLKTYEGVVDYLVRDQLLAISNHELYLFLKEKMFTNGTEMAAQADLFSEARGGSQQVVVRESRQKDRSLRDSNTDNSRRQFNSLPSQGNNSSNHWKCNHCGRDHRSFDCRRRGN